MAGQNSADLVFNPSRVVGFEDEAVKIMERLIGKPQHLDVISIVGMAGLGKTTLARKIYDDPSITHYFYIRAWISISQVYRKRDLLLGILSSPHIQPTSDIHQMSDANLSEVLYKCLKENKYLIVMDDIWNTEAWDDLKRSFPNDNNGSRIMLTSRIRDVALHVKPGSTPYDMRFLSKEESLDLLHEKVFHREICPSELMEVELEIVEKCKGLPLAIVIVAGVLAKTEKTEFWWKQVADKIRSYIVSDPRQCMEIIELSYNHLPDHLKPCFLYFGAFPEDYEIPVSKLTWLWIAEGFIVKKRGENLEDEAEDFLMDLIERSLIVIANRRSDGGVKSCRIHDLLRDLCLRKAKEENFLQEIDGYEQDSSAFSSSSSISTPIPNKRCRMCFLGKFLSEHSPNVSSLLCFDPLPSSYLSIVSQDYSLLRVLDLWHALLPTSCPIEFIGQLVHLRYLALQGSIYELPSAISNLCNLETLIAKRIEGSFHVSFEISRMTKLRHFHLYPGNAFMLNKSETLDDLQTISTPTLGGHNLCNLTSAPNLRKIKCILLHYVSYPSSRGLEYLLKLETLKMHYHGAGRVTYLLDLPASLRKVTLSRFHFDWIKISKLARLPNLEVLKLLINAFDGDWLDDTSDVLSDFQPFPKLKFLKFESLNITHWNASRDHFPNLQRLVLNKCRKLVEIQSDIGDIPTLQTIELNRCGRHANDSAREILKEQRDNGNEQLKVNVYPPDL